MFLPISGIGWLWFSRHVTGRFSHPCTSKHAIREEKVYTTAFTFTVQITKQSVSTPKRTHSDSVSLYLSY